jgi:hypothetical protein
VVEESGDDACRERFIEISTDFQHSVCVRARAPVAKNFRAKRTWFFRGDADVRAHTHRSTTLAHIVVTKKCLRSEHE